VFILITLKNTKYCVQIENKYEWSGHIEAELLLPGLQDDSFFFCQSFNFLPETLSPLAGRAEL
jgi:hypothetical protein